MTTDEPFALQVHAINGQVKIRANGRIFFERPFNTGQPCHAVFFAEDGAAQFKNTNIWQLAHDDVKSLASLVHFHGYNRQSRRAAAYQQLIDKLQSKK